MTMPPVVSDSSGLIALHQIGHLDLLARLFSTILVPPAVVQELRSISILPSWIIERALTQPVGPRILQASLGAGESEAISLALEVGAQTLILDDRQARRLAAALGLPMVGIAGVLLAAKRSGFLPTIRPHLDALRANGFFIAPRVYNAILAAAGEIQC